MRDTSSAAYCVRCGSRIPAGVSYCPGCGANVKAGPEKRQKSRKELKATIAMLSVLLAFAVATAVLFCAMYFNVYFNAATGSSGQLEEKDEEIASLNEQLEEKDDEIASLNEQKSTLQTTSSTNKAKAEAYDDIVTALGKDEMGGTSTFYVSKCVLHLSKGGSEQITLTIPHSDYMKIYTDVVCGDTAWLEFMNGEYYGNQSLLTVHAGPRSGITLFKLTNSVDSSIIYILVIITCS